MPDAPTTNLKYPRRLVDPNSSVNKPMNFAEPVSQTLISAQAQTHSLLPAPHSSDGLQAVPACTDSSVRQMPNTPSNPACPTPIPPLSSRLTGDEPKPPTTTWSPQASAPQRPPVQALLPAVDACQTSASPRNAPLSAGLPSRVPAEDPRVGTGNRPPQPSAPQQAQVSPAVDRSRQQSVDERGKESVQKPKSSKSTHGKTRGRRKDVGT